MNLQEIIDFSTQELEIESKRPDSDGTYFFSFENDIDIKISQYNSSSYILLGNIYKIEKGDESLYIINECSKLAVSVLKIKRTVVFIDNDYISLYNIVNNEQTFQDIHAKYIKDFIYDMNWWKNNIEKRMNLNVDQYSDTSTWISG